MSLSLDAPRWNPVLVAAALVLIGSFGLAATSGPIPIRGMIVQLGAIATICLTLLKWRGVSLPRLVLVALLAIPAVPILQLVPLPPEIWQALPGREIAAEMAALTGGSQWQPISLDPNATLRSFLALLPPLAMFLAAFQLRFREKQFLVGIFVVIGLLSTFLGVLQIVLDDKKLYFFWDAGVGKSSGLFGNRNHQAVFLAICALFSYYMLCEFGTRVRKIIPIALLIITLFAGAVFATQSRSGVAILIIILVSSPLYLYFDVDAKKLLYGSILFFIIVIIAFSRSHVVLSSLDRFGKVDDDGRYNIWPDAIFAIEQYFPFGSGAGTFTEAFQPFESLNLVSPFYVPRAHNDYLELLLEIGVVVIPLMIAIIGLILNRAWRLIRSGKAQDARLEKAMVLAIAALALHSIVDYPIQTVALGSSLGMFLGILFSDLPPAGAAASEHGTQSVLEEAWPPRRRVYRLAARVVLLLGSALLVWKVASVGISDAALQARNYTLAAKAWPGSANAVAGQSEVLLGQGRTDEALAEAKKALSLSSQSTFALRSAARAAEAKGLFEMADQTWAIAARLGWRDGFVQSWVFQRSVKDQDYVAAARAADAMARTDFQRETALSNLVGLVGLKGGQSAVAQSMASRPPWSAEFLKLLANSHNDSTLASFLGELARLDALPEDASLFPVFDRLLVGKNSQLVVALWQKQQPSIEGDPRKGLVDSNFAAFVGNELSKSFFGWRASADPGVQIELLPTDVSSAGSRLRVTTSARRPLVLLNQLLALTPGAYRLEYETSALQGSPQDFYWEVRCRAVGRDGKTVIGSNRYGASNGAQASPKAVNFSVPDFGCAAQSLSLKGSGTLDEDSVAEFSDLRIRRFEDPAKKPR